MTDFLCIQTHRIDGSQAGPHLMIFGGAQVVTQSSLRGRLTQDPRGRSQPRRH